ncbi:probable 2-oxoglutarate-dependent dioxygenase AOP1 [Macadamia integrifolia]|uniref:probable 2-oxoglutarate-dependent dioxygenase AOP1 n=1 Tax=Macadamia integrifolia TaxID=60698 RepID=UPI001C4F96FF|nr:probable 2-oxoglutarate-dependent dioxygenase AOP1 [Macadamia integrifolia]
MAEPMGPVTTHLKFPTIDFSKEDLKPGIGNWEMVREQVREALEEYGCFEVFTNEVPLELHEAIFAAAEQLFDLPVETKLRNTSKKPLFGYIGHDPIHHESLCIDEAPVLEKAQSFTDLIWPEGNSAFCEIAYSFSKGVMKLEHTVTKMVFESFGVEKYHQSFIRSTNYILRFIKYPGTQTNNECKVGIGTHTDKNLLTILHQNQVNGLEVQTQGGEWIKFTPSPSSFIVLVGEAFMAWSNGRLHCPRHRVMISASESRYSIGLFSVGKGIIQSPDELVDEEHPLLFKPFDNLGLISFYQTEEGHKAESTIKAYCGL